MTMQARALLANGVLLAAVSSRVCAADFELETGRPGNLFAHGGEVTATVKSGGDRSISWRVVDYGGAEVRQGRTRVARGGGQIEIGKLPRGYYELVAGTGGQSATLAFGVVTDHSADHPRSGRLNIDGATAWLERKGRHEALARMLRIVGIGWVRERFSWGGTETEKGTVRWQQYDTVADTFSQHGINVYQIFHDSPGWSHGGRKGTRNPRDLREVYRFAKRLAEHYKGRVRAWEVWNEPDIFFWPDLGDTFAGVQKAAYLGFKAGDAQLPVLIGSFCRGYCPFDDSLFEAGIEDYFDIFNWHTYSPPSRYADILKRYIELLRSHGCAERPVWLTEAGIRLVATEAGGELSPADERKQADFVPRSFARSLAAGTDRHFFFVYPYYLERGVQFGSLRGDLSPRPAFIAIAAAVDILGEARFLGCFTRGVADKVTALAFDNGRERILVVWSGVSQEAEFHVAAQRIAVADVVGRRERRETETGALRLEVGPSPQYLIGLGAEAVSDLSGRPRPAGALPVTRPHPVVIRGQAQVATIDKGDNSYLIGEDDFAYTVEVCNLDEREPTSGRVRLELPGGWKTESPEVEVALDPMGRVTREFTITPGAPAIRTHKIWVRPRFGSEPVASSVSYFRFDLSRVPPSKSVDLGLDNPERWRTSVSGNGTMATRPGPEGGVHFAIQFAGNGDRWCYPTAEFSRPRKFSGYDGIAFEYRCHAADDNTIVRLQAIEAGGSMYLSNTGWKARKTWTRVVCLFKDLSWGSYSPKDANGKLDTQAIRALMIGLNTPRDDLWLEVRGVQLVRMTKR